MQVTAIRTRRVTRHDRDLFGILDEALPPLAEGTVVAITSKIVALCDGRTIDAAAVTDKAALIRQEADRYLAPETSRYGITLTITRGRLIPTAGIDESNGGGVFILWPRDAQATANAVRRHLTERHGLSRLGVILTDSTTAPLRWGVTGVGIAHSGFEAVNSYIGQPDLFGKPLRVTKVSVLDGLAAAAVLLMGEGSEQTPLAVIEDLPFVTFQDHDPTPEELTMLRIPPEDDLYAPLLSAAPWQPGQGGE